MSIGPFYCENCGAAFDGTRCPECDSFASDQQRSLCAASKLYAESKERCNKQKRHIRFLVCLIVIIVVGVYFLDAVNFRTSLKVNELSKNLRFHAEIDSAFEGYSKDYCAGYYDGFERGAETGLTLSDHSEIYEEGVSDGRQHGYDAAVAEFCYNGDAQYGGWYEGYEDGYAQRYRDAFGKDYGELIYDLFERRLTDPDEWKAFKAEAKRWGLSF